MALFKALSGNRANLPEEKHDGYVYFCEDDGSFHVDYKDAAGALQRKQINAKDAETLCGMTLDEIKTHVAVQSNWAQNDEAAADYIKNKPNLATVATTGSYNDLLNKPSFEGYATETYVTNATKNFVDNTTFNEAIQETNEVLETHKTTLINSETGAHGMRYYNNALELYSDYGWQPVLTNKTMSIVIDFTDSNPDTCCSYADGAIAMTAKASTWDEFFGHYPVLMKDGKEVVKLNPNNYAEDINGNPVDITSGEVGDVMIAFPRRGLKLTPLVDDYKLIISFTDAQGDNDYKYYAHEHNGKQLDTFYMSAYNGSLDDNGKLRSLSGKTPVSNITIGEARTAAQANGDGYEQFAYYQLLYLQCMYIMKYKSLNGQTALGMGWVSGDIDTDAPLVTGSMDTKGLDFGIPYSTDITEEQQKMGMKFAGIENFWGSIFNWVDGIVSDENCNYLITRNTFNDTGLGYEITALVNADQVTENGGLEDYLVRPVGTTEGGFAIHSMMGGSETTYFSDFSAVFPSSVAGFGGCWYAGLVAGPFFLVVDVPASGADPAVGARCSKL